MFELNRVILDVFDKENTIIMSCYELIVTFNFLGNGPDGCTFSEKRDET